MKNTYISGGNKVRSMQWVNNYELFPTLSECHSMNLRKFREFQIITGTGNTKNCDSINNLKNVCPVKSTINVGQPGIGENS